MKNDNPTTLSSAHFVFLIFGHFFYHYLLGPRPEIRKGKIERSPFHVESFSQTDNFTSKSRAVSVTQQKPPNANYVIYRHRVQLLSGILIELTVFFHASNTSGSE